MFWEKTYFNFLNLAAIYWQNINFDRFKISVLFGDDIIMVRKLHNRSQCQIVQAHMHFMEKITGNSVAEPSTINLFSIDQPTPQVIQTRSYIFTNYLLGEKTVKRL